MTAIFTVDNVNCLHCISLSPSGRLTSIFIWPLGAEAIDPRSGNNTISSLSPLCGCGISPTDVRLADHLVVTQQHVVFLCFPPCSHSGATVPPPSLLGTCSHWARCRCERGNCAPQAVCALIWWDSFTCYNFKSLINVQKLFSPTMYLI